MVTQKSLQSKIRTVIIYVISFIMLMVCLLPMWNVVAMSFSSSEAVTANRVGLIPVDFTFSAYEKILEDQQFWRSFGISVVRVILTLVLNMVLMVLLAYPLSKTKREFRGRNVIMNLLIFAMLFNGGMIPVYLNIRNLGLLNTIWALVLPQAVPIFNVILLMNFFGAIPRSLDEAAVLDGARPFQILTKIYLPCSKPGLATVALFSIVNSWNDFYNGLLYITKIKNYPLMTYIQSLTVNISELAQESNAESLQKALEVSNKNLNAAKIVVALVPLLVIYPALQKYFITGIVVGSVKE